MNRKAAIELSMNFLVVIIISLVILAGGIALLYKFIAGGKDIIRGIDDQTRMQIEQLLDDGEVVAFPYATKTIKLGGAYIFGLGILNINTEDTFQIVIEPDESPPDAKEKLDIRYNNKEIFLKENERVVESIRIAIPKTAVKGSYFFNLYVKKLSDQSDYGGVKKITVTVP